MEDQEKLIDNLINASNIMEIVKATVAKLDVGVLPSVKPEHLDDIILRKLNKR